MVKANALKYSYGSTLIEVLIALVLSSFVCLGVTISMLQGLRGSRQTFEDNKNLCHRYSQISEDGLKLAPFIKGE